MLKQMVGLALAAGMVGTAQADYITGFESSDHAGYVVGETIHGVDGWFIPGTWDETPTSAAVINSPVASGTQALHFQRISTGRGARIAREFDAVVGDSVEVRASLAWGRSGTQELVSNFLFVGDDSVISNPANAAVQVGFRYIEDGAAKPVYFHYYDGASLERVEVAAPNEGEYYDIVAVVDMTTGTYDLSIAGSNINVTIEGIAFRDADTSAINNVLIASNVRESWTRVDNLALVPEPATIGLLGVGALLAVGRRR